MGHEGVNDGTEGHRFSFTLLYAFHQHAQHVLQLILRSIIHKLFTICFTHWETVLHTLLLNEKRRFVFAPLYVCLRMRQHALICGNRKTLRCYWWLVNHNKWCNSFTRAFKSQKAERFFFFNALSIHRALTEEEGTIQSGENMKTIHCQWLLQ